MDSAQFKFTGVSNSVMETYTSLLVPRLFIPWARHLLEHCGLQTGETVLDVACGPGTVTHLAAERVGQNGRVVGTDISPEMIALAKQPVLSGSAAPIEYVESPAAPLNVADAQFDLTLCQQGMQFFPEKVEAVKEMKRATRPGGKVVLAVWAEIEDCTSMHALYRGLKQSVPDELAEMMRAPFSFSDAEALKTVCVDAGLTDVDITRQTLPLVFEEGPEQAFHMLQATPLGPKITGLDADKQKKLKENILKELQTLVKESAVEAHMTAHLAIAQTPT